MSSGDDEDDEGGGDDGGANATTSGSTSQRGPLVAKQSSTSYLLPGLGHAANDVQCKHQKPGKVAIYNADGSFNRTDYPDVGSQYCPPRALCRTIWPFRCSGAHLGIDQNTDPVFSHGSVTMTQIEPFPWWEVHLGATCYIMYMMLYHRQDCCKVTYGTQVALFNGYASRNDGFGNRYRDCSAGYGPPCIEDGEPKTWNAFVTYEQRDLGSTGEPIRWDPGMLATRMRITVMWDLHVLSVAEFRVYGWFQGCPEDYACANGAQCINRECVCNFGYSGMMCEKNDLSAARSAVRVSCLGSDFEGEVFIAGLPAKACSPLGRPFFCGGLNCKGNKCRNLPECAPAMDPVARLPTGLRVAEFIFLSSMIGIGTCLTCPLCLAAFWHHYGMDVDEEEDGKTPDERLQEIRSKFHGNSAKVVPLDEEEDVDPLAGRVPGNRLPPIHLSLPKVIHPRDKGKARVKPKGSDALRELRSEKKMRKYLTDAVGLDRASLDSTAHRDSGGSMSLTDIMTMEVGGGKTGEEAPPPEWAESGIGKLLYERKAFILAGGLSMCVFCFVMIVFMFMLMDVCIEVFASCPKAAE